METCLSFTYLLDSGRGTWGFICKKILLLTMLGIRFLLLTMLGIRFIRCFFWSMDIQNNVKH